MSENRNPLEFGNFLSQLGYAQCRVCHWIGKKGEEFITQHADGTPVTTPICWECQLQRDDAN